MAFAIAARKSFGWPESIGLDLAGLAAGGATLRFALSAAMSRGAGAGSLAVTLFCWLSVFLGAVGLGFALRRILRRADSWMFSPGAALILILAFKVGRYRPELTSLELPLAILFLTPAGVLVWHFLRRVGRADELQRLMLLKALGVAAGIQLSVAVAYAFLEGCSLPRVSAILWAGLLFASWNVGLGLVSRRYRM